MDSIKVNKISKENIHEEESHVRNSSDEDFGEMQIEDLNCSITMLGCSPVGLQGAARRNRIDYGKRKVAQASQVRLQYAKIVPGTQSHQTFVPINTSERIIWPVCS
jgi:hypothetical protein